MRCSLLGPAFFALSPQRQNCYNIRAKWFFLIDQAIYQLIYQPIYQPIANLSADLPAKLSDDRTADLLANLSAIYQPFISDLSAISTNLSAI